MLVFVEIIWKCFEEVLGRVTGGGGGREEAMEDRIGAVGAKTSEVCFVFGMEGLGNGLMNILVEAVMDFLWEEAYEGVVKDIEGIEGDVIWQIWEQACSVEESILLRWSRSRADVPVSEWVGEWVFEVLRLVVDGC